MSQRSSTRLHQAPGGSSQMGSLIFGGGDESNFDDSQRNRRGIRSQQRSNEESDPKPQQQPQQQRGQPQAAPFAQDTSAESIGRISSNRFASGTSQNTGNVITDRSTTRIHAPPGGASSFRLG